MRPAGSFGRFIAAATDDSFGLAPESISLYEKWTGVQKSAELHMYAKGDHGFAMRKQNLPTDHWIDRFTDWLELQGCPPLTLVGLRVSEERVTVPPAGVMVNVACCELLPSVAVITAVVVVVTDVVVTVKYCLEWHLSLPWKNSQVRLFFGPLANKNHSDGLTSHLLLD